VYEREFSSRGGSGDGLHFEGCLASREIYVQILLCLITICSGHRFSLLINRNSKAPGRFHFVEEVKTVCQLIILNFTKEMIIGAPALLFIKFLKKHTTQIEIFDL